MDLLKYFCALYLFNIYFVNPIYSQNTKVVEVTTGLIQGIVANLISYDEKRSTIKINSYLGIPYAEPPIKFRRFLPPTPKRRWNNILMARKDPPICPQTLDKYTDHYKNHMSEDCLYLNIYSLQAEPGLESFPVIVYIHGGSYTYGSSTQWPPYKIVEKGIVVVTVSYRLGVLGFFTTGDALAPSNNGLRDQALALEWIHANIAAFNGNPDKISIMGESAGAASVGLHMISPLSGGRGYFRSVIAMSGTEVARWAVETEPWKALNISLFLAHHVGCFTMDSFERHSLQISPKTVDCLRSRTPNDLTHAFLQYESSSQEVIKARIFWQPVVDGAFVMGPGIRPFLPHKPEILLKQSKFPKIPIMLGMVENEESLMGEIYSKVYGWEEEQSLPQAILPFTPPKGIRLEKARYSFKKAIVDFIDREWDAIIMKKLMKNEINLKQDSNEIYGGQRDQRGVKHMISNILYYHYLPWADPTNKTALKVAFTQLLSDYYFTSPADVSSKLHHDGGCSTFLYIFNYRPQYSILPKWLGVVHGFDLPFFFGIPWLSPTLLPRNYILADVSNWTDVDRDLSSALIQLLTNFVIYGDPTPSASPLRSPHSSLNIKWLPVSLSQRPYLHITREEIVSTDIIDTPGIMRKDGRQNRWRAVMGFNYRQRSVSLWNGFLYGDETDFLSGDPKSQFFLYGTQSNADRYRAATWGLAAVCTVLAVVLALFLILQYKPGTRNKSSSSIMKGQNSAASPHYDRNIYVSPDELLPPRGVYSSGKDQLNHGDADNNDGRSAASFGELDSLTTTPQAFRPPDPLTSLELDYYEANASITTPYSNYCGGVKVAERGKQNAPLYDKSHSP